MAQNSAAVRHGSIPEAAASRVLHRLGVPTVALYAIGGLTGGRLRALIDQEGFAHRPIAVAGQTRQSFTAHERNTGRQYRFVLPGPELSANEWQGLLETTIELAEKADLVVASGFLPPGVPDDFYARLANALDARGVRLILDSSGPGLATTLARAHVHLVKPNINEIVELAGEELAWPEEQADWCLPLDADERPHPRHAAREAGVLRSAHHRSHILVGPGRLFGDAARRWAANEDAPR